VGEAVETAKVGGEQASDVLPDQPDTERVEEPRQSPSPGGSDRVGQVLR
jgi:hypothetical protein